jgi:transcriptional regulator with XRE-family HTH domain
MDALVVTGGSRLNTHKKPPFLRRRLGRRLRVLREEAGLSLEEAAVKLEKTRSSLNRIETGTTRADVHFVRSLMDVYDIYADDLLEQTRAALKPLWFRSYGVEDLGYVDVETHANSVCEFTGLNLPGLLQTEAYVRAMLGHGMRRRSAEQLNNDVQVRLIRKGRLTSVEGPLRLTAIIDEAALRRNIGGPAVMSEQLRQLIEMATLPTVTLQVLPLHAGAHSGLDGAFTLLVFPEPDESELLYVEYATGALHIEDEDEVRAARLKFDVLRSEALSPGDSMALIEHVITALYAP